MPSFDLAQSLLEDLRRQQQKMLRLLGRFVRAESPSFDKAAVDRFGRIVAAEWRNRGARVRFLRQRRRGDHIRTELWLGRGRPAGQILILGHLDTVYDLGTLARMPFCVSRGRAYGPGSYDMKGDLVIALFAAGVLRAMRVRPSKRLVFLWTSDEAIASESSRAVIATEARRSAAVLVLEPASAPSGRLHAARERAASAGLFRRAQALAITMGLKLEESFTGGGSDGNFTAALGVPTLDGLGGVGEGAHSLHENVVIRALPQRAALLAALLDSL